MSNPTGEFNLGNARGYVDIDPTGVRTGLDQAKRQLNSFRQDMAQWVTNTGQQIRNFGATWTAVAAPLGVALGAGINAAADFDEALIEIQARTGLTADAMDEVRTTALQLGADTVFSTQQAANAFLQLLTAGLTTEQALATLPNVLDGAAAGGLDLGTSADIVTNVMSAFNLTAEESGLIIEAMSRAAASSPSSMLEIGEAMQRAGGMARTLGLDVDRTAAIFSIFAQNGLRGSEAGTQLNSMLRNMSRQTPDTQQAWQDLGVSLFDANGQMRDLDTVFQEISASMANMSMEDQNRIATDLAGSYGLLGFNALLASDGIGAMEETMAGQASATDVARARMESFKGQLNSMMGSVQALMITALTPFMNNVLRPIITMIIGATNAVTAWTAENETLTQMIVTFLAVLVGLGPVLTVIGQAMIFIGGALGFWLSPIGLVIASVTALAFVFREQLAPAIGIAQGFIEGIRVLFINFRDDLASLGLGEAILGIFGRASEGQGAYESTLEGLFARMGFSRETAIQLTEGIFTIFSLWFVRIRGFFARMAGTISPLFTQLGLFFNNNIQGIAEWGRQLFNIGLFLYRLTNPIGQIMILLQAFGVSVFDVFETVMGQLTNFFTAINAGVPIVDALKFAFQDSEFFGIFLNGFNTVASFITGTVLPTLDNLRTWFVEDALPAIRDFVTQQALPAIMRFVGWLGGIWETVSPGLSELGNWFINDVMPQITNIVLTAISNLMNFATWLGAMWNIARPSLEALGAWFLTDGLAAIGTYITTVALPFIQNLIDIFGRVWTDVSPFLLRLFDWFMNVGLPMIVDFVVNDVMPVVDNFIGLLGDIWTKVQPHLANLYDWFINTGLPAIMDFIEGPFTQAMANVLGDIGTFISNVNDAVTAARNFVNGNPLNQGINVQGRIENLVSAVNSGDPIQAMRASGITNLIPGGNRFLNFFRPPGASSGFNFLPKDQIIQAHQGEAMIPADFNPFNPNANNPLSIGQGGNSISMPIHIGQLGNITSAEATRIGENLGEGIVRKLRANGQI